MEDQAQQFPEGMEEYTLKNGNKTIRRHDGAVWFDESKGANQKGWFYGNGEKAPDAVPLPTGDTWTYKLKNGIDTVRRKDGAVWFDKSKGSNQEGWFFSNGDTAPATIEKPKPDESLAGKAIDIAKKIPGGALSVMYPKGYSPQGQEGDTVLETMGKNYWEMMKGAYSGIIKGGLIDPVAGMTQLGANLIGKTIEHQGKLFSVVGLDQAGAKIQEVGKKHAKIANVAIPELLESYEKKFKPSTAGELTGMALTASVGPGGEALTSLGKVAAAGAEKLPGVVGKIASKPLAQAGIEAASQGLGMEAAMPVKLSEGEDYATEKAKRMATTGAVSAALPPAIAGAVSTVKGASTLGKALYKTVAAKDPALSEQIAKMTSRAGVSPHQAMAEGIDRHFENLARRSSETYKEALSKEGANKTDMSELVNEIDNMIGEYSKSIRGDKLKRIKALQEYKEAISTGEHNVATAHEESKRLGSIAYKKSLSRDAGVGGDTGLDASEAMRLKKPIDKAIDNSAPAMKGHSEEVNGLIEGAMSDPALAATDVAKEVISGAPELAAAKRQFKETVAPTRSKVEGGKLLRKFSEQPNPEAKVGMVMNADSVMAPKMFELMDEPTRSATRSAFVDDIWKTATSEHGGIKAAEALLDKRKHIRDVFFTPGSEDAVLLDNLQKTLNISKYAGKSGAFAGMYALYGMASASGIPHHIIYGVEGLLGLKVIHGAKTADRIALNLLSGKRGTNFINALTEKSTSEVKALAASGAQAMKEDFAKTLDPSKGDIKNEVTKFNVENAPSMRKVGVEPLTVSEAKTINKASKLEEANALQKSSTETQASRNGTEGGDLAQGGQGVRPSLQGEEIAGKGKAQEAIKEEVGGRRANPTEVESKRNETASELSSTSEIKKPETETVGKPEEVRFEYEYNDPKYVTHPNGMTKEEFRSAIDEVFGEKFAQRMHDMGLLDAVTPEEMVKLGGSQNTRGLSWKNEAKAAYNVSQLRSKSEAVSTVMHEVGVHVGLRNFLGSEWNGIKSSIKDALIADDKWIKGAFKEALDVYSGVGKSVTDEVSKLRASGDLREAAALEMAYHPYMELVGKDAVKDVDSLINNDLFTEEVIGRVVNSIKFDKPTEIQKRLWDKIVEKVQEWFNKASGKKMPLTRDQILDIVGASLESTVAGGPSPLMKRMTKSKTGMTEHVHSAVNELFPGESNKNIRKFLYGDSEIASAESADKAKKIAKQKLSKLPVEMINRIKKGEL